MDEVAPHISCRRGSRGFVARKPAEEKAALLRDAVAVCYARSPHGRAELARVLKQTGRHHQLPLGYLTFTSSLPRHV